MRCSFHLFQQAGSSKGQGLAWGHSAQIQLVRSIKWPLSYRTWTDLSTKKEEIILGETTSHSMIMTRKARTANLHTKPTMVFVACHRSLSFLAQDLVIGAKTWRNEALLLSLRCCIWDSQANIETACHWARIEIATNSGPCVECIHFAGKKCGKTVLFIYHIQFYNKPKVSAESLKKLGRRRTVSESMQLSRMDLSRRQPSLTILNMDTKFPC